MVVVGQWTGADACRLQAAARLTNEELAARLGVAVRTVAGWHERPGTVPRAELQRALDVLLERLDAGATARFGASSELERPNWDPARPNSGPAQAGVPMTVALAIVVREADVLLVRRRSDAPGISWGFPAGTVKPEQGAEGVAVTETLAETGVRCRVVRDLGQRVHPVTGVLARYFLADYLGGQVDNRDLVENSDVAWVPIADLDRYIDAGRVFGPVLEALDDVEAA